MVTDLVQRRAQRARDLLVGQPVHEALEHLLLLVAQREAAHARDARLEKRQRDAMHGDAAKIDLPELFLIESRFRRAMLQAELDFATGLADSIADASLTGVSVWRRIHELRAEGVPFERISQDPVRYLGEEGRLLQPPDQ